MYFSRLGRMFRATAKVVGHGKSRRPRHCICVHGQKFSHFVWAFTSLQLTLVFCSWFSILVFARGFCSRFFCMYFSRLGRMFRATAKDVSHGKSSWQAWCYYQHTTNELQSGCFHQFANDSSALKRLRKFVVVRCNCVHGKKLSHFIQAFTSLQLTSVFVLGF